MIRFDLHVDLKELRRKAKEASKKAQFALDNQVLKDSNFYAPQDIGMLQDSGITSSDLGKGKVAWNTAYARRLYYNPQYNFSKDKNPNAQGMWFEAAKTVHKKEWRTLVAKITKDALK